MNARPRPARILLIDDDAEHLALLQKHIEGNLPAVVDVATTSQGAEQKLNERCYDLVMSDLNLQGELGTTICRKVLERDKDQPLLLLTNYDGELIAEEADRLGVPIYSKMEITQDQFLTLLNSLLARRPCAKLAADLPQDKMASVRGRTDRKKQAQPRIRLISPYLAAARAAAAKRIA